MAIDPRKRQKNLERRKAKQKAERRELAQRDSQGIALRLKEASAPPILHCCTTADIWEQGIGQVLVSRQLGNGQVAFAAFLVDLYCLGVKDVYMNVAPRPRYEEQLYAKLAQRQGVAPLRPECARKLVEGAVQYGLDLGLAPHPDYRTAKLIFGDISAQACTTEYAFGKDGKPLFIAGPYDSPTRCEQILRTLHDHRGSSGHHFTMRVRKTGKFPMNAENLRLLIQAGNPIISMETPDESRAIRLVREVALAAKLPLMEWSVTEGLLTTPPEGARELIKPSKIIEAIQQVKDTTYPALYLFKDLGPHCKDAQVVRSLRDVYFSPDSRLWTLILLDAVGLPPEVRRLTVPFDIGWPTEEELNEIVRRTFQERKNAASSRSSRSSPGRSWKCSCRRCVG